MQDIIAFSHRWSVMKLALFILVLATVAVVSRATDEQFDRIIAIGNISKLLLVSVQIML